MGGYESARCDQVYRAWRVRDVLLAFEEMLKRAALEQWQFQTKVWAATAPHTKKPQRPPELPEILRG